MIFHVYKLFYKLKSYSSTYLNIHVIHLGLIVTYLLNALIHYVKMLIGDTHQRQAFKGVSPI
jgi:hypothetical protein